MAPPGDGVEFDRSVLGVGALPPQPVSASKRAQKMKLECCQRGRLALTPRWRSNGTTWVCQTGTAKTDDAETSTHGRPSFSTLACRR